MSNKLTPFDSEGIVMIENVAGVKVTAYEMGDHYVVILPALEDKNKTEAITQALKGRFGARLIEVEPYHDNTMRYCIAYDKQAEEMPIETRSDYTQPDPTVGETFCRTLQEVQAVKVERGNEDLLRKFTGGGTMTIPRTPNGVAKYSFPNENGVMMDVYENWYIIRHENGHYTKMHKDTFAKDFGPK